MNREELSALPAVVDVPTAARLLGLSRTAAYLLIRSGSWPTPIYRLGRLIRIPTAPMLELLCIPSPRGVEFSEATPTRLSGPPTQRVSR
jgi:predicted DNA-binding transcriptional regulator AlpA